MKETTRGMVVLRRCEPLTYPVTNYGNVNLILITKFILQQDFLLLISSAFKANLLVNTILAVHEYALLCLPFTDYLTIPFQVSDYRSYWNWVQNTFIPTLMPRYWYGPFAIDDEALVKEETTTEELKREKHKKVKKTKTSVSNIEAGFEVLHNYDDVFVADHGTAILVGTARLRQLRVIKGMMRSYFRFRILSPITRKI